MLYVYILLHLKEVLRKRHVEQKKETKNGEKYTARSFK
jgi:hypothetical protein